ncbi:TNF receptor-associated factor family protein DDB_G0272098 [Neoarius graeffei]|uniref:TNF receptor-associated factor family protein DDB_G0272098 n=1 Tax=Neoarius graeffei TaxID=443677 RepID=UPI00298C2699|nr:TNF receptor-associated factor family protein DDB_G0272098 [Neoarius graeffei]
MSQSGLHLITFAFVTVLYVCMVTSVSGSTAENNGTNPDFTPSDHLSNKTVEESGLNHVNDTETVNTTIQLHEGTLNTSTSPDTPLSSSNNSTHGDDLKDDTIFGKSTDSITTKSITTKSITTKSITMTSPNGGDDRSGKAAGIFFLIFILIIIIVLAVILYILWKKGKRYSFDLTNGEHDTPLRSIEPIGTFEQTKGSSTNLDYIQEDSPNKNSPVANGCSGEMPEQTPYSEQQNVAEENSFTSDLSLNSPVKKVEFNLELELIGGESELTKQATNETTDNDNENNNNDTNTGNDSADLFTEISLDDTQ